jgi:hypothetical protein
MSIPCVTRTLYTIYRNNVTGAGAGGKKAKVAFTNKFPARAKGGMLGSYGNLRADEGAKNLGNERNETEK